MTRLLIYTLLLLICSSAFAHQQKQAITTILFNDRTGRLEIMHRFYMHDAEHAVGELFGDKDVDIHRNKKTQQTFVNYLNSTFKLHLLNDQLLLLELVGYEIEGDYFWLYQETPIPETINGFKIKHNALRDVWNSQTNLVNIEGRGKVQSLVFDGSAEWLFVEIDSSK